MHGYTKREMSQFERSSQMWGVTYSQQWEDPCITWVDNQARLNFLSHAVLANMNSHCLKILDFVNLSTNTIYKKKKITQTPYLPLFRLVKELITEG